MTRSLILEIDRLAGAMDAMKQTVRNFLGISTDLAAEHRFNALLQRVCREAMSTMDADAGLVYLVSDDETALDAAEVSLRRGAELAESEGCAAVHLDSQVEGAIRIAYAPPSR